MTETRSNIRTGKSTPAHPASKDPCRLLETRAPGSFPSEPHPPLTHVDPGPGFSPQPLLPNPLDFLPGPHHAWSDCSHVALVCLRLLPVEQTWPEVRGQVALTGDTWSALAMDLSHVRHSTDAGGLRPLWQPQGKWETSVFIQIRFSRISRVPSGLPRSCPKFD